MTSGPTMAMLAAVRGEPFHIGFSGAAQYDYVPDVARAAVTAAHSTTETAAVYNVPGALADVADVVALIQATVAGSRDHLERRPACRSRRRSRPSASTATSGRSRARRSPTGSRPPSRTSAAARARVARTAMVGRRSVADRSDRSPGGRARGGPLQGSCVRLRDPRERIRDLAGRGRALGPALLQRSCRKRRARGRAPFRDLRDRRFREAEPRSAEKMRRHGSRSGTASRAGERGRAARRTAPSGSLPRPRAPRRTSLSRRGSRRAGTARWRRSCSRARASSRRALRPPSASARSRAAGSSRARTGHPGRCRRATHPHRPGPAVATSTTAPVMKQRLSPSRNGLRRRVRSESHGHDERGRDRGQVHHREQHAGLSGRPAALVVGVGEPGVETRSRRSPSARRSRRAARRCDCATAAEARSRPAPHAAASRQVSTTQATSESSATHEIAISAPRQPPSQPASGTASAAALVEPIWMPGRVDAGPGGRPALEVLLDRDRRERVPEAHPDPDRPGEEDDEPRRRHRPPAGCRTVRSAPARSSSRAASRSSPRDRRRRGRTGPCRGHGIVPSRPTTACDVPNASWIDGISGPTPTICGRSVSAARKSATSVAVGRLVTSHERDQRRTLPRREPRQGPASTSSRKCGLAACASSAASST